jgi:predicted transposase YdaD
MHDHDALFRHTFADPQHAASLLAVLLPPAIVAVADWASLKLLPGSFVDAGLRDRESDLLFSLDVAGATLLVYVLFEHKSDDDRWTAFQLLQYVVRVHETFRREHPGATALPPVIPVVVHHGPRGFRAPRSVYELIGLDHFPPAVATALSPLQPNLHFLLDDLAVLPEPQICGRTTTPQATLTLLLLQFLREVSEADPVAVVERWLPLWRAVGLSPASKLGLLALLSYLMRRVEAGRERFVQATYRIHEDVETMGKTTYEQAIEEGRLKGRNEGRRQGLEEGLEKGLEKGREQGLEQGLEAGLTEGKAAVLLRQLRKRFGALPAAVEQRIRSADGDTLDTWAERVLDATSLNEVLA